MRSIASIAVVATLAFVGTVQGQTVRSHSSLRIPTPAIDQSEGSTSNASRRVAPAERSDRPANAGSAPVSVDTRFVPAREASLLREIDPAGGPELAPLDSATTESFGRTVSASAFHASPALAPVSSSPVGSGVQFYGPSADSVATPTSYAAPTSFAAPVSYGSAVAPTATVSSPVVVPTSYAPGVNGPNAGVVGTGIMQTSFSAPTTGSCCGAAGASTVVTGMQPMSAGTTFPTTTYPVSNYSTSTVFAPPVADAASYPPSLSGSTIPGGGASGQLVPYVMNPVAVNIPAVPVDESRLQPIVALRPTVPEESYAGRGILGQPELYVRGQHVRNVLRYITLW